MSPSSTVRSFAITLAIAVATIGPQVNGFTIYRAKNTTTSSPIADVQSTDLPSDKSFQLQVRDDLERPYDIKTEKNNDSNNVNPTGSKNETTSQETTSGTDKETEDLNVTEIENTFHEVKTEKTVTRSTTEIPKTTEFVKIPTISSDTVEVFDSIETDTDDRKNNKISKIISGTTTTSINPRIKQPITSESTENAKTIEKSSKLELSMATDQIATDSETEEKLSSQKDLVHSSPETTDTIKISDSPENSTETSMTLTTSVISDGFTKVDAETTTGLAPTVDDLYLSIISSEESIKSSKTFTLTSVTTETPTDKLSTLITEPSWKKYTTIVRKRVSSSEETAQTSPFQGETMTPETSNTHLSYEKAFNMTTIPAFIEKLQKESQSLSTGTAEIGTQQHEKYSMETESTLPSESSLYPIENSVSKRTAFVQSKRAGFLNYSEKSTTPVAFTSPERKTNDSETNGTMEETEAQENDRNEFKKVSGPESLSQLAEDAIQEELMKEEALFIKEENAQRYRNEQPSNDGVKPSAEKTRSMDTIPEQGAIRPLPIDDILSVQPISHGKSRTTLYTVSPNYKPMKKIDVQPSKPFVRDPDDNSWRNESISSLGIVFKPKNSSISFKEVLKNKTQVELNNLQEKYNKNDVPDLRVRLEKIAEGRKTKKRKMNNFGEEVYTDYEEGSSAEGTTTPAVQSTSSGLSSVERSTLTPSPHSSSSIEPELTTPMTTWKIMEVNKQKTMGTQALFKSLGLDPLTTVKPKNFYNIAEYYDTTDEYDAEYVTLSNIDLKKQFAAQAKAADVLPTSPIAPFQTKPMKSYLPERKPTIQYFPPRKPQKVNVNNFDVDFENKINLFTFTETPKTEPPFVTVPTIPVATERPATRATAKPTDVANYNSADLSKNFYLTNAPRVTQPQSMFAFNDGSFNRGSYVIKHYKDFLDDAVAKSNDDERTPDYVPFTEPPARGITMNAMPKQPKNSKYDMDYDYDLNVRKEVLNRFVDNFNQNSDRFKVDFPVLYNNSIVHRNVDENGPGAASSRTFLQRLYGKEGKAAGPNAKNGCEPNCDVTVELSPAYELHYYVPEQEEKEEVEPATAPYRYRL